MPCYRDYINGWRRRFLAKRLSGLQSRHHSQPPSVLTAEMEARILERTRLKPPDGSTHWSTRKLARLLKINHNHVASAWRACSRIDLSGTCSPTTPTSSVKRRM